MLRRALRLNPFMNQVYFYTNDELLKGKASNGLNPFMNQVYFY